MKKFIKKFSIFAFIFLSLFICVESLFPGNLSGVQSGFIASLVTGGKNDKEILPESLSIKKDKTTLNVGDVLELSIDFYPEKTSDTRVKVESNNNDIVSINNKKVTALKEGNVDITVTSAKDATINDTISLIIYAVELESINASTQIEEISVGTTTKLDVSYLPTNTTYINFEYYSSDSNITTIDEFGIIKGIKPGNCEVYVKDLKSGIESKHVTIKVNDKIIDPVLTMKLPDITEIYLNQHVEITPIFNEDASDKSFHIVSMDNNIIGVENNFIIGKNFGKTTIEIISNSNEDVNKTLEIEVKEIKARAIHVPEYKFTYGTPHKLRYNILSVVEGLEVTNKEVLFYSSDESIATIDENGYIYGLKQGKVTVTVVLKSDESIRGSATITFNASSNTAWEKIKGIVRKLIGHFSLFLITGIFGYLTFREKMKYKKAALVNIIYGTSLAIISELLQLIPVDRKCLVKDMFIDAAGYLLGMIIIIGVILIYKSIKKRRLKNKKS